MTTHWHDRWQHGKTAWDLDGPHPLTRGLLSEVSSMDASFFSGAWMIPGCGRAHDVVELIRSGASRVMACDLVPLAMEEARSRYGDLPNVFFDCRDVSEIPVSESGAYSGIFDRAMLCALNGRERDGYVAAVRQYLRQGGVFVSIPFRQTSAPDSGPPFQISEAQLRTLFGAGWEILKLEGVISPACDQKILSEWVFIARKK